MRLKFVNNIGNERALNVFSFQGFY